MVADVDLAAVDADGYDEDELEALESRLTDLEARSEDLTAALADHDRRLDEFDRRARDLDATPFVGASLSLVARTRDGLAALADDLDDLVAVIERDAERSRKAIDVFETIEAAEEQKLADLFDPEGPASRTFERLTDGRYAAVTYDAEAHRLAVERRDGRTVSPAVLSQATTDQLYFATRVSLARQLLGAESGFLLLDDPFVAADAQRLERGFESLLDLAADGWQIIYLTAKDEVRDRMVSEYDLDHTELEALPV
jgi:YD repeat-containing protein